MTGVTGVTGTSKEGEGGREEEEGRGEGEDVTIAGQTNKQGKIEPLSQLTMAD